MAGQQIGGIAMAKLLQLLEQDCTLTPEQLASMTDMTVEEVKAAIKRYEEDKVILGYQAIVDWDRTQREAVTALIEVKVTPQRGDGFDRVAERIYKSISRVLSWTVIYLVLPLPAGSSDAMAKRDEQPLLLFLGLASSGVYMAFVVTDKTVGSYPTFPPLPDVTGGLFLLH